jgi:hypothetical protein
MKTVEDLREHLFAALDGLRDKEKPMDIERAEAIAKVAQVIVNSATIEVKMMNATGAKGSGFIPEAPRLAAPGPSAPPPKTVHRIR